MATPFDPTIFGKFYLLERLGAGGMAEIFRAKTAGTSGFEKELVVKRILPALSSDQQFVRMLVNEAKLTVALTHPTIAQVYELGEVEGRTFISMEMVEGTTLHDLMWTSRKMGRPLTSEQSIYLCLEVLRGLDYAHKKTDSAGKALGIIHCDVSPDNVMVTWDGGVKLLDFGIARAAQASLSNHREGVLMGKLSYAAPEQAEGDWFDHRVDLFAVGVIFYELLTGSHPFGKVDSVEALIASRKVEVLPPSQAREGLPTVFDDFIKKSLARSRDERFQSAMEMADELVDLLFPTPTIAVGQHLSTTVRELYRPRIEKQQKLRADDTAHIQRLQKRSSALEAKKGAAARAKAAAEAPAQESTRILVSAAAMQPIPPAGDPKSKEPLPLQVQSPPPRRPAVGVAFSHSPPPPPPAKRSRKKSRSKRPRLGWGSFLLGLFLGAAGGGAATWTQQQQAPPALVVLSEPPGAAVFYQEQKLGETPLTLDRSPIRKEGGEIHLRLADHREVVLPVAAEGKVALHQARLESSLRELRIESWPTGATLRINGEEVGTTPHSLQLPGDKMHRIDLEREGYEQDSFVLLPDDVEGEVVRRQLSRAQ